MTPDGAVVPEGDEETLGEVWIRGENVMKGYWGKPEATAQAITEDGWFRSGDQVTQDAAGYIQVVDR
ncbi:AMP-binding protein, partial [Staphylococcus haemolyticus]|nr:AMP-binding protein [Staphylococcus haemolyticus]